jgi:hypothetical protein
VILSARNEPMISDRHASIHDHDPFTSPCTYSSSYPTNERSEVRHCNSSVDIYPELDILSERAGTRFRRFSGKATHLPREGSRFGCSIMHFWMALFFYYQNSTYSTKFLRSMLIFSVLSLCIWARHPCLIRGTMAASTWHKCKARDPERGLPWPW